MPDVGSVTFQPADARREPFGVLVWQGPWAGGESIKQDGLRCFGWATVVTHRDQWVYSTRVEPAVECCNAIVPVKWHYDQDHWQEGEPRWEFAIKVGEEP